MDFLLPYVTSEDKKWRDDIERYDKRYDPTRYRDFGTLKYLFRGVDRYMPFIDRIVLLVAYPSQIPNWVNRDAVKIVTHEEIMPREILPTFNSSVIECYINNIPDLSERFIYANDDMFPVGPLSEESFFHADRPIINYDIRERVPDSIFLGMCAYVNDLAADLAGRKSGKEFLMWCTYHYLHAGDLAKKCKHFKLKKL